MTVTHAAGTNPEMGIHIIVDGYNLIGSQKGLGRDLAGLRDWLIQELQQYRRQKGHPVTVVFDGWLSGLGREVEARSGGFHVFLSRIGEKADEVI
jgi:predicted RNA-binding protein with PIN domain